MKYYRVRILATLFFMGSFGGGILVGAEHGKLTGWTFFVIFATSGIILHRVAGNIHDGKR